MAVKIRNIQAERLSQIQRQREADANEAPRLRALLAESDAKIAQLKAELASAREAAALYDPEEAPHLRTLLAEALGEATQLRAELAKNISVARSKYIAALCAERDVNVTEHENAARGVPKVSTYMDRLEVKPSTGGAPPGTDPRVDALCRVVGCLSSERWSRPELLVEGLQIDLETIAGRR